MVFVLQVIKGKRWSKKKVHPFDHVLLSNLKLLNDAVHNNIPRYGHFYHYLETVEIPQLKQNKDDKMDKKWSSYEASQRD